MLEPCAPPELPDEADGSLLPLRPPRDELEEGMPMLPEDDLPPEDEGIPDEPEED